METIKEFLVSDIYLDIIKELGVDNFNQDVQSVEVEELKNRLRQRQFLLEGVNVNIRMYNFDDVQCTVIPSVAYGFVTGMNLQLC